MTKLFHGYCIDTAPLIDLYRRKYPPDIFPALWFEIESLIRNGSFVAPREVRNELEVFEEKKKKEEGVAFVPDRLLEWTKKNKGLYVDPNDGENDYMGISTKITNETIPGYGGKLVDIDKETPDADPFVIGLAKQRGWTVINSENNVSPNPSARPKIPNVCNHYNVECIDLLEFFRRQKWQF